MYQSKNTAGVTVAMLRAFVCVSRTLNLSKACEELGATRQTVRRHLTDLEDLLGAKLFNVSERQYRLTSLGVDKLESAKALLVQLEAWSGASALEKGLSGGLEYSRFVDAEGRVFLCQQHPVSQIAIDGLPLMKKAFASWGNAQTSIEHEAMQAIRPYTVLYRKGPSGWVFVDVGQSSAYARWFGWAWAKSAIGKLMNEDDIGDEYNEFISGAYAKIYNEGGVRLDHLSAHLPKDDGVFARVTFQRLLMGSVFPDGTPGLSVLAIITDQVKIDALDDSDRPKLPQDWIMDSLEGFAA